MVHANRLGFAFILNACVEALSSHQHVLGFGLLRERDGCQPSYNAFCILGEHASMTASTYPKQITWLSGIRNHMQCFNACGTSRGKTLP